jgi:DNA transformation protein
MFGGAGIYRDGIMFGLIDGARAIFLKADDASAAAFRDAGCRPFIYEKDGRRVEMSYWSLPDAALDDSEMLRHWAELAYGAAQRAKEPAARRRGARGPRPAP